MELYQILKKKVLSPTVMSFELYAPMIAQKAIAGQFVILRSHAEGERVPVTLVDWNKDKGSITVIIQTIGKSTATFNKMEEGGRFLNVAGPLGCAVELKKYGTIAVIGGGVGIAEVYPIGKALKEAGNKVVSILGARNKELLILEEEMKGISDTIVCTTDDGSYGQKGLVTDALQKLADDGVKIDAGFVIGPLPMMKFTCLLMKKLGITPYASLNPIMLDGTGMCGCCRVTVDGQTRFACVDGPMFEASDIDFDELIRRTGEYKDKEALSLKKCCDSGACKIGLH
jgi:NAD(P)H-flavin reductase